MTTFKTIFGTISISILLVSCGGQTEHNKPTLQETPKALQDNKLEIKSYSRSGDLTEELYQELVEKTPSLKNLENELDAFSTKPNELNQIFNQFDSKSNSFYSSANNKATTISDSLLKKKILSLITTSSNKYTNKTAELNSLIKQISNNSASIDDHHNVLKIVLTLPKIEKYQDDNLPDKNEFKSLIKEQNNLIMKIDSLTPKY